MSSFVCGWLGSNAQPVTDTTRTLAEAASNALTANLTREAAVVVRPFEVPEHTERLFQTLVTIALASGAYKT